MQKSEPCGSLFFAYQNLSDINQRKGFLKIDAAVCEIDALFWQNELKIKIREYNKKTA